MDTDDLYQDLIVDHFKNPRHRAEVNDSTSCALVFNPLCGDQVGLSIRKVENVIEDIGFSGKGCAISQASASMMSELCLGRTSAEARSLREKFLGMLRGETSAEARELLGDALALEGVRKFSARVRCAVIAWEALEQCLNQAEIVTPSTTPTDKH